MRILRNTFYTFLCGLLTTTSFAQMDTSWTTNLNYRSLGPSRGGRSNAVCGVLNNRDLFYMGSVGGGVWKTDNGGKSWNNISDGFFGGSIGSVAVSGADDNVIYVGEGEETVRGNVSSGKGIWKSVDAGKSWKFLGLKNSKHIPSIVIHPKNPDIAFAAVLGDLYKDSEERGLYMTSDGGSTWKKVLYSNASSGCNEVVYDPLNLRVMYASTWNVRRTPHSFSSGGQGSALWRSKDGGQTWENLMDKPGMPKGLIGKITISASTVKKDLVFAMIENAEKGGLYQSVDGGEHWKLVNSDASIRQRAWYFSRVYCDTKDAETVYVMNVRMERSTDGGKTFQAINTPHVDHHGLWIDPNDAKRMIVANDGGGQVSYNGGNTWSTYHNQSTMQFYRVTTDNHVPYRIYGAQQDNSTVRVNHITGEWEGTAGGESAHIAPDPSNPEIVYAGSYGGYLSRYNHTLHENRGINVWPDNPIGYGAEAMKYRFQWNFPLFFSPHNPKKLYAASNHLHVSLDGGDSWKVISPDLTKNDPTKLKVSGGPITKDNTGVEYYCTIFAAMESQLEKDLIYAGSDDGLLHITRDGGANWKNITPKMMPAWTMINSIEVDPFEKGKLYVVSTSYKLGDDQPYLFTSSDYGQTWKLMVNGIESDHFLRVVRADKKVPGLLYAGTERGMYISFNGGQKWEKFQRNLPIVPVTDLIQVENDLIAATQGRGFWIIDNLDALRKAGQKMDGRFGVLGTENSYANLSDKAGLTFYLNDSIKKGEILTISVLDKNEKTIKTWSSSGAKADTLNLIIQKGMNYFSWDLQYPNAKKPDDIMLWWASTEGPTAAPGKYFFVIEFNGKSEKLPFVVHPNPNGEADSSQQVAKFEFLNEVIEKVDEIHKTIVEMQSVKNQLSGFLAKYPDLASTDSLNIIGNKIIKELDSLINDLHQTKIKSEQDPINYPIKINNKLAHLNSLVGMGSMGPTTQAISVKEELVKQAEERIVRFKQIKTSDIPSYNKLILRRQIEVIIVK